MNHKPTTKPKRKPTALAALKRASQQAIELARQTKTPAWVLEGDKLVDAAKQQRKSRKG